MRRENRKSNLESNRSIYITIGVLILAVLAFIITFVMYSNKLDNDLYALDSEYLAQYTNQNSVNSVEDKTTKVASSSIGKTVDESKNNTVKNVANEINNKGDNKSETKANKNTTITQNKKEETPVFKSPLEGEISKEYAKDNLIYSNTLKEWTTHFGIDIKAEKGSNVKASASGKVKYIKNDPRYGLTIIIEHNNGFETLYSNLLTTDFVSEGEEVKVGQTIGTVGDSAVYEIVDDSHLHFEILKNNENLNPADYIKD